MSKKNVAQPIKSEEKKKSVVSRSYQYSGPLPHPKLLNAYDPETRKVIVSMAQKQSEHRRSIESAVVTSDISNERLGMILAMSLTVFMIIGGIYLLMQDKDAIGFFLIFGPSVFQAGNYIYNRKKENELREEPKAEEE